MIAFLSGKAFTYVIMSLYAIRSTTYALGGHYGSACYWLSALFITISAEFLIKKFP